MRTYSIIPSSTFLFIIFTLNLNAQESIEGKFELVRRYAGNTSVDYSKLPFKTIWIFYNNGTVMMDRIETESVKQDGVMRKQSDGGLTYSLVSDKLEVFQNGRLFAELKRFSDSYKLTPEKIYKPWIQKKYSYISLNTEKQNVNKWIETAFDLNQNIQQEIILKPVMDLLESFAGKVFTGSLGILLNIIDESTPVGGVLEPQNNFFLISDGNWVPYKYDAVPEGYTTAYRLMEGESFVFLGYSLPAGDYSSYTPRLTGYPVQAVIEKLVSFDLRKGKQIYKTITVFEETEIREQRGPYLVLYNQRISLPKGLYILTWGISKKYIMVN